MHDWDGNLVQRSVEEAFTAVKRYLILAAASTELPLIIPPWPHHIQKIIKMNIPCSTLHYIQNHNFYI